MHAFLRSAGCSLRAAMIGAGGARGVGAAADPQGVEHPVADGVGTPGVAAIDAAVARFRPVRRRAAVAAAFTLCATGGVAAGAVLCVAADRAVRLWRVATVRPPWRGSPGGALVAAVLAGLVVALTVVPRTHAGRAELARALGER